MDKFSQLIAQGVAKFEYTPIAQGTPNMCPICRAYNNVYSLANDTHMSILPDGRYVITGHAIADKRNFDSFLYSDRWGWFDFTDSGQYSPSAFFYNNSLRGHYDILNGDVVYILDPVPQEPEEAGVSGQGCVSCCPDCVCKADSAIPESLRVLTTDGNAEHVRECFKQKDVIKALNESKYVLGNNWVIAGLSDGYHLVSTGKKTTYIL